MLDFLILGNTIYLCPFIFYKNEKYKCIFVKTHVKYVVQCQKGPLFSDVLLGHFFSGIVPKSSNILLIYIYICMDNIRFHHCSFYSVIVNELHYFNYK